MDRRGGAAVGEDGDHLGDLYRGHQKGALADSDGDGLPGEPVQVVGLPLPLPGGDQAALLSGQIDSGLAPQPQRLGALLDQVDLHALAQGVEVDVAGLLDGGVEVDGAVAGGVPTAEGGVVDLLGARTEDGLLVVGDAVLQTSQGDDELEDGARGVESGDRLVDQGLARVSDEALPLLGGEVGGEEVGVEEGRGDQGEDLAVLRVHDDHRPGLLVLRQKGLDLTLELDVQGEVEARPLGGGIDLQDPLHDPDAVDQDHPLAVASLKKVVVVFLQPGLPDELFRSQGALRGGLADILLRDGPDIAVGVRSRGLVGVEPLRFDLEFDGGEGLPVGEEVVGPGEGDILGHEEVGAEVLLGQALPDLLLRKSQEPADLLDGPGLLPLEDGVPGNDEVEGDEVLRQDVPLPVLDEASGREEDLLLEDVPPGCGQVEGVVENLDLPEEEEKEDHHPRDDQEESLQGELLSVEKELLLKAVETLHRCGLEARGRRGSGRTSPM